VGRDFLSGSGRARVGLGSGSGRARVGLGLIKYCISWELVGLGLHDINKLKIRAFSLGQGCQMVCFQTKIPIWVNFGGP
jgi:hypothetical protein